MKVGALAASCAKHLLSAQENWRPNSWQCKISLGNTAVCTKVVWVIQLVAEKNQEQKSFFAPHQVCGPDFICDASCLVASSFVQIVGVLHN